MLNCLCFYPESSFLRLDLRALPTQPFLSHFLHLAVLPARAFVATLTLPLTSNRTPGLLCSLQFRRPLKSWLESVWKVMKSPAVGEDNYCLCCMSHLHLGSFPPSLPGFEDAAVPKVWRAQVPPRAQLPEVLTLQRPCSPIQLRLGRTNVLVLSCTLQSKEGAEEAWLGAGEGQKLQPKVPRGTVSSPPVQRGLDQFGRLQQ